MKTWKILTITIIALVTAAFVTVSAFAYMGGRGINTPYGTNTGTNVYGTYTGSMMGSGHMGGMMGGYRYGAPSSTSSGQYGWGCHGGNGYNGVPTTQGTTVTIDQAVNAAKSHVASLNNADLTVDEVEEYTQNFYVLVKEKSTGIGAFELLVDKYTAAVYPEMGPNMMWNTKYGMHNSEMMGWISGTTAGPMTVTVDQAKTNAQQFLTVNYPGTAVGDVDTFYGYYHIDVLQAGQTFGMLSVNGYTGQVWFHNWHGAFIQEVEL
jgi:hypothetical protein